MSNKYNGQSPCAGEFSEHTTACYVSFAEQIVTNYQQLSTTIFIGINGCQGSGKSTLSSFLQYYIRSEYALECLAISLDDFYLSKCTRLKLGKNIHPLLATRGVPGTHDIPLLQQTLSALKQGLTEFPIPKFNKASDDLLPKSQWPIVSKVVDIVIVEGWCWGTQPQLAAELLMPVNTLECQYDSELIWRNHVNQQIIQYYQPLYQLMNSWLFLRAPSFNCVYQWRVQQEQALATELMEKKFESDQKQLQSAEQIAEFILYFQRLTEHALHHFNYQNQTTFLLDEQRNICNVTRSYQSSPT